MNIRTYEAVTYLKLHNNNNNNILLHIFQTYKSLKLNKHRIRKIRCLYQTKPVLRLLFFGD